MTPQTSPNKKKESLGWCEGLDPGKKWQQKLQKTWVESVKAHFCS